MHKHTTQIHQATKQIQNTNIITIIVGIITMGTATDMDTVTDMGMGMAAADKKT